MRHERYTQYLYGRTRPDPNQSDAARRESEINSLGKKRSCKQTNLALLMINHNIVGLDIAMHDTLAVAEVERLQQLEDIVADIIVGKAGVQSPEVGVIDSLEDQAGGFALVVADDVQQCHHIRTTGQILENLDLSLNLLFLHGLENLDDTFLIVDDVDALEYLGVLSSAYNRTESANSRSSSVPTVQGAAAGGTASPRVRWAPIRRDLPILRTIS